METLSYCQLMQRCGELAADNAALKLWASQSVELWDAGCDMDWHMRDLPLSVSTDAILASLRAEGVEMFGDHLRKKGSNPIVCKMIALGADEFAAQLRSKTEVQHD